MRLIGSAIAVLLVGASVAVLVGIRGEGSDRDARAEGPRRSPSPSAASPSLSPSVSPSPTVSPTPSPFVLPTIGVRPSPVAKPPAARPVSRPPLTVLNNSTIEGLGAQAAAKFRAAGWRIADVGGISGRYRYPTVYYDQGQLEAARLLVRQFPSIKVIEPRWLYPRLPGEGLTVVVTRDFE